VPDAAPAPAASLTPVERRRLLRKLAGDALRSEQRALEHPQREARRLAVTGAAPGHDVDASATPPPLAALRDVAEHARAMQPRFHAALTGHDLALPADRLATRLGGLRHRLAVRSLDPTRAYRGALLELRQGIDVASVLRDLARELALFAVIRWCDDWLGVRCTLVARAEAQLTWFPHPAARAAHDDPGPSSPSTRS